MSDFVYGWNAVSEALRGNENLDEVLVAQGSKHSGGHGATLKLAAEAGVTVRHIPRVALDKIAKGAVHQGIVATLAGYRYRDLDELLAIGIKRDEPPFLLVLDAVQDVHNLGSLIRTAEACGVHGVLIPPRRAAGVTAAVRKASAGAVSHVGIARVELAPALDQLHDRGVHVVGMLETAETLYAQAELSGPLALVVGSEGRGLSAAVARRCDSAIRLPMMGRIESLNAAVAGSIVLYEALRQRGSGGSDEGTTTG